MRTRQVLAITLTVITLVAILLSQCQYTTGTTLDTQLFPHSRYWSIQHDNHNVITLTTYTPAVWYLGIGDTLTVSYVDNR